MLRESAAGGVALILPMATLHLPRRRSEHRIDWLGAAALTVAITALVLITTWGGSQYARRSAATRTGPAQTQKPTRGLDVIHSLRTTRFPRHLRVHWPVVEPSIQLIRHVNTGPDHA
jgi:hypothetical protein